MSCCVVKRSIEVNGLDVRQKLCVVPAHKDKRYDQKSCCRGTYVMLVLAKENKLLEMSIFGMYWWFGLTFPHPHNRQ